METMRECQQERHSIAGGAGKAVLPRTQVHLTAAVALSIGIAAAVALSIGIAAAVALSIGIAAVRAAPHRRGAQAVAVISRSHRMSS